MDLFYKQYGDSGEPVFILHGIFGMLDNWHNIAKALSSRYRVYTIDARNHGQSPHSPEMSYALMADDVVNLADKLGLETFILMGHSMGGKTAMLTATLYPERISRLIVVDIAPKAYKPGHTQYFRAFEEIDWSSMNNRKDIDEALSRYESDMGVRLFLAKNIDRADTGGFRVKANIAALKNAYSEIIGEFPLHGVYRQATLFVLGGASHYLIESDKPVVLKHFPMSNFISIPEAGHWVHADKPAEFLDVITDFLDSN